MQTTFSLPRTVASMLDCLSAGAGISKSEIVNSLIIEMAEAQAVPAASPQQVRNLPHVATIRGERRAQRSVTMSPLARVSLEALCVAHQTNLSSIVSLCVRRRFSMTYSFCADDLLDRAINLQRLRSVKILTDMGMSRREARFAVDEILDGLTLDMEIALDGLAFGLKEDSQ